LQITVLEGCRGTGKSTLAFKLRQRIPETTLINFTGFHQDGEEGLVRVRDYYKGWFKALFALHNHESKYVFDRFYFTELVFSLLYKDYNFSETYWELSDDLFDLASFGVKINIVYLTISDKDELKQRLTRDKVPFGKAEESVFQSLSQQKAYDKMFDGFKFHYDSIPNIHIHKIDTSGKTNEEVYQEVIKATN
jgi:deoxyguanosine kinase